MLHFQFSLSGKDSIFSLTQHPFPLVHPYILASSFDSVPLVDLLLCLWTSWRHSECLCSLSTLCIYSSVPICCGFALASSSIHSGNIYWAWTCIRLSWAPEENRVSYHQGGHSPTWRSASGGIGTIAMKMYWLSRYIPVCPNPYLVSLLIHKALS